MATKPGLLFPSLNLLSMSSSGDSLCLLMFLLLLTSKDNTSMFRKFLLSLTINSGTTTFEVTKENYLRFGF
jgi:hypothetical protein